MLPYNEVTDKLCQGSVPDPASSYEQFTMIVLCAQECQPELPRFKGRILRPAFDDTPNPSNADVDRARTAASEVGAELMRGGRVLVTCAMGLNRSGLVTGLALVITTRLSPIKIVERIRTARGEHALCNSTFAKMIFSAANVRDQYLAGAGNTTKQVRGQMSRSGRGRAG
jgi:predicted protein tyrosine phosphatase